MFGKYKHSVDEKGRLFVPSKLREELGSTFYVTLGLDHCLSVYTEAGWKAIVDKYNALPIVQARKMRFLFANAAKCEPDKQGRFLIPAELRQYAGLAGEVTFIGQGGHAEIWDSEAYEALERETLTPENLAAVMASVTKGSWTQQSIRHCRPLQAKIYIPLCLKRLPAWALA